uniref:CSON000182 protein n=1 Tax=Culicoides sonorensis TaxID=179676 RepID=A0A336MEC8_CULSO
KRIQLNNYINYSNIAARLLRKALKPEFRAEAARRDETHIKFTPWEGGKPANECMESCWFK